MKFTQKNKNGENKILIKTSGDFIDQSKNIQKYIIDKDRQQKIANVLSLISILVAILVAIL